MVFAMVVVGGATRLTDSGLSITQWKPIMGALPPLSAQAWREFELYKQIPQYQLVNPDMTLEGYKGIFWWEWAHRLLGRLVGVVFAIPFVVFLIRREIPRRLIWRCARACCALGGLQGLVGWWMVSSGLSERVSVAPERLMTHLGLALALFVGLVWTALDAWRGSPRVEERSAWRGWALAFLGAVFFQSLLGALVAGNDAGLVYNDWPLMNGGFFPDEYAGQSFWGTLAHSQGAVQLHHRLMAYAAVRRRDRHRRSWRSATVRWPAQQEHGPGRGRRRDPAGRPGGLDPDGQRADRPGRAAPGGRGAAAGDGHGLRLAGAAALIFEGCNKAPENCHTPSANRADSSWSLALIRSLFSPLVAVRSVSPRSGARPIPQRRRSAADAYYKAGEAALARQMAVGPQHRARPRTSSCSWATAWASRRSPPAASMTASRRAWTASRTPVLREAAYTALSKTYSHDTQVTDSAAGITAIMTGVKTRNKVIGLTGAAHSRQVRRPRRATRVETIAELAKAHGLSAGAVTTTRDHPRHPGRDLRPHRLSRLGRRRRHAGRGPRRPAARTSPAS